MFIRSFPAGASVACLIGLACGTIQAQQSRGVNPAEIDSRFDVIVKNVELESSGRTQSLTLKYDQ